jgi:hypothetical protein
MSGIDEFIERAEAAPTIHPDRPSDPEPLATIQQELFKRDGSVEDEDVFEVTCRSHDGDGKIDTEPVHDLALEHDLRVRNTIADFDTGEVRLELIPAGGEADA